MCSTCKRANFIKYYADKRKKKVSVTNKRFVKEHFHKRVSLHKGEIFILWLLVVISLPLGKVYYLSFSLVLQTQIHSLKSLYYLHKQRCQNDDFYQIFDNLRLF